MLYKFCNVIYLSLQENENQQEHAMLTMDTINTTDCPEIQRHNKTGIKL